jgi:hypothetical protein
MNSNAPEVTGDENNHVNLPQQASRADTSNSKKKRPGRGLLKLEQILAMKEAIAELTEELKTEEGIWDHCLSKHKAAKFSFGRGSKRNASSNLISRRVESIALKAQMTDKQVRRYIGNAQEGQRKKFQEFNDAVKHRAVLLAAKEEPDLFHKVYTVGTLVRVRIRENWWCGTIRKRDPGGRDNSNATGKRAVNVTLRKQDNAPPFDNGWFVMNDVQLVHNTKADFSDKGQSTRALRSLFYSRTSLPWNESMVVEHKNDICTYPHAYTHTGAHTHTHTDTHGKRGREREKEREGERGRRRNREKKRKREREKGESIDYLCHLW